VDPAQRALHMPKYLAQVEEGAWVKFTLIQVSQKKNYNNNKDKTR
jgi:hypothetical protein